MPRAKKPKRKVKIRFDFVPNALRDRLDMDYVNRIPDKAQLWLKKFIEEIYGRKFQAKPLAKNKVDRSEIYHETYAAREDVFNVCVRVHVDPTEVDLSPSQVQERVTVQKIEIVPEVERTYMENGVKITKYKTVKS